MPFSEGQWCRILWRYKQQNIDYVLRVIDEMAASLQEALHLNPHHDKFGNQQKHPTVIMMTETDLASSAKTRPSTRAENTSRLYFV